MHTWLITRSPLIHSIDIITYVLINSVYSQWLQIHQTVKLIVVYMRQGIVGNISETNTHRQTDTQIIKQISINAALWFIRPVTSSEEAFNQSMNQRADQHKHKMSNTVVLGNWGTSIKLRLNFYVQKRDYKQHNLQHK